MIEIKMTVDDVDYEEILETLYPLLEERLYNKIENPLLAGLLSKMKGLPMVTIKAMLKTLPQKTKDELVVLCLNYYKENIILKPNKDNTLNVIYKDSIIGKIYLNISDDYVMIKLDLIDEYKEKGIDVIINKIINYIKDTYKVKKIMIIIDLNNVKVIKELKKIGFDYFKDDELNIFLIKKLN